LRIFSREGGSGQIARIPGANLDDFAVILAFVWSVKAARDEGQLSANTGLDISCPISFGILISKEEKVLISPHLDHAQEIG